MKSTTRWYVSARGLWWQRGRWVATLDPRYGTSSHRVLRTKRAAIRAVDGILAVDPGAQVEVWYRRVGRGGRSWDRVYGVRRV